MGYDQNKKKNIKNKHYRKFLDEGIIKLIDINDIRKVLDNIKGNHKREARALIICLYYTGARPNEILKLCGKDFKRSKSHLVINIKGSKRGLPRPIRLSFSRPFVTELYKFSIGIFPDMWLFWHYRGNYKRVRKSKSGRIIERTEITQKLTYHFKRWFEVLDGGTIPPYYLRHNRFSLLIAEKGITAFDIKFMKGSRTLSSVDPYLHMSAESSHKLARKIK